ncbi:MAG TPA: hypothetical protein VGO34_14855 [Alphaproteobacteria bacterium]|jgi:hypothetical protein
MAGNFDLLGDPIPENWGKRGRPPHLPTELNRNKVRLLLAFGWLEERIARALRITKPTLRKHYFSELKHRDEARDALEANHKSMLYEAATKGNVGAMKELGRLIDRDLLARSVRDFEDDRSEARTPKLGKKEEASKMAQTAGDGSIWGDDLKSPAARLN